MTVPPHSASASISLPPLSGILNTLNSGWIRKQRHSIAAHFGIKFQVCEKCVVIWGKPVFGNQVFGLQRADPQISGAVLAGLACIGCVFRQKRSFLVSNIEDAIALMRDGFLV